MCPHLRIVNDDRTATIVCMDCCQVIDEKVSLPQYTESRQSTKSFADCDDFILDVCDRIHIFKQAAMDAADLLRKWKGQSIIKKSSHDELCCLSIYHTLKAHNVPRSLKEIAYACGVSIKDVWKLEKQIHPKQNKNALVGLLRSNLHKVGLNIKDEIEIQKYLDTLKTKHFAPNTIIASVFYLYAKSRKMKLTMKTVSSHLQVSSMSVYRCIKYLKLLTVF